ncbi:Putative Membrane dipeptidase GliJ (AFU_orthologue; AFUA_6G09650) [Aspergillus calidoustus]|uniref:Dipeptidase n=1 Tax=Aspergillus calidoustus TaxID=454130 RepID=A0A0U5FUY7_ASPCI|nr:Putative Membrane dipeptidase GliJ (AFU_orthologue; AFUA_6G09650) [Aspergillus calidoustus]
MEKTASELPQHTSAASAAPAQPAGWKRRVFGVVAVSLIAWFGLTRLQTCGTARDPVEEVLSLQPLTDGHNDFPFFLRKYYHNHIYQSNFSDQISLPYHVDFPRLAQGRVRGQFWSVYIDCNDTDPEPDYAYVHDTLQQIDLVRRLAELYPEHLELVPDTTAFRHTFETSPSKIASFLGVEGLHQIGHSPATLRLYHSLGVRYTTLTHACHNKYADSATPSTPRHNGLSAAGRAMVLEMNRLGMAVDLAHVSAKTMHDALDTSKAPVIFSHSSAYAICPHPRNVPDNVLHQLAENDGIIMITFLPEYTRCDDPARATLSDVADHIQHVGELIGYQYVGLGSDFDGMERTIKGLEDVSKYPDLIAELLRRGVSVKDVAGVIGGNILRVMGEIEKVSKQMIEDGITPLEDDEVDDEVDNEML